MNTYVSNQRLLKVAKILDTVPEEKFNLSMWRNSCGTVACAVGWAASDPGFKRAGFSLRKHESSIWGNLHVPHYGEVNHWTAVEKFFGLSREQAEYLFLHLSYSGYDATPREVAERIRNFVKNGRQVES
jgi:hypothetical protein